MVEENNMLKVKKRDYAVYLIVALIAIILFSQYQVYSLKKTINLGVTGAVTSGGQVDLTQFLPTGVPSVYGNELGVSFDRVEQSLNVLAGLETSIDHTDLGSDEQVRYTRIATSKGTSCEFCCGMGSNGFGFQTGIKSDCGCSHNLAFSGLTKYLLKNHSSELNDDEILDELNKWKTLFFPKQMLARIAQEKGISGYEQLPSMVGGC